MGRLYLTPTEMQQTPIGIALANQIGQLAPGVLDQLLFRASERVDSACKKRIGAPLSTTVGTGGIAAGGTTLPVASTLGFDNLDEQCVILDTGAAQEIIPILPGGVTVSSFTAPYPGTLALAQPTQFAHAFGAPVVGCYQEVTEAGKSSSSDIYAEAFTQEAQIALAHAPMMARGADFTRLVFLKHYPIVSIAKVEHSYSFDNVYIGIDASSVAIDATAGTYKFRIGTVVIPQGLIRTTYTAGRTAIPDDLKTAASYFLADQLLAFANPYGAIEVQMGKRRQKFLSEKTGMTMYEMQAVAICERYRRRT